MFSLVAQTVKNRSTNSGDPGSIPGSGRTPGRGGHGNPLQLFLPGESDGQRSLEGCSPVGRVCLCVGVGGVAQSQTGLMD